MAHLFQSIGSFAGDYSGAAGVLQDLDGMLIFCDGGACMGGFLYAEDPKGKNEDRRIFSASLREKQIVMGIDKKLRKDALRTYRDVGGRFVGLIGTPVSAVIGADLNGIAREICKEIYTEGSSDTLLPAIAVETNGWDFYDAGQEKAYLTLVKTIICPDTKPLADVNVIGATSLDMWDYNQITDCIELLQEAGAISPSVWGANGGLSEIAGACGAKLNIAVSVSAIRIVKELHKRYGTPYLIGYPLGDIQTDIWKSRVQKLLCEDKLYGDKPELCHDNLCTGKQSKTENTSKSAFIIGEQLTACALRELLWSEFSYGKVDVASFFKMDRTLMQKGDLQIKDEASLIEFLKNQEEYDLIIADPLCFSVIPYHPKRQIMLPHIAVSSILYLKQSPNLFGKKASIYFHQILDE